MSSSAFFADLITWIPFITAALLCFLPMKNQLRFSRGKTIKIVSVVFLIMILVLSAVEVYFGLSYNGITPLAFLICFIVFRYCLSCHTSKALFMFVLSGAATGFLNNFSNGYDAVINPFSDINHFSFRAAVFQALINVIFLLIVWHPLRVFGRMMVDRLNQNRIWYTATGLMSIFLTYNLFIVPRHYETLHVHNVFLAFWISLVLFFTLMILLCIQFYFIVTAMIETADIENENNILQMQETQFKKQQRYLEAVAKERHDFKHTVRTIKSLAAEGKTEEIESLIDRYIVDMPGLTVKTVCSNPAVNAVLNYYMEIAKMEKIPLSVDISLPKEMDISDNELCSIFGNILENAINACREIEAYKRFIRLTAAVRNDYYLFITAVNSFNGTPEIVNGTYFSTGHKRNGLGLVSIGSIARSRGGNAYFSHEGCEFFSNVMLPVRR